MVDRCNAWTACLALLLAFFTGSVLANAAEDRPWRIVILTATDPYQPAFIALDRGMREVLTAPGAHQVEIYSEALDSFRFPGPEFEARHIALLKEKYADRHVDVVITVATEALDFAERHRDVLWPASRIVFNSVWEDALQDRSIPPWMTGIPLRLDFTRTVELLLRLQPDAQQLVVIAGASSIDQRLERLARAQLAPFEGRLTTEYWSGRTMDELAARVARLPPSTSVLYLSIYRDANGHVFVPRDALERLFKASSVPIFGVFDTYVGKGMIAGWTDDTQERGRQAARMVQRVLSSPTIPLPPPVSGQSACVADARELRRFDISTNLLPEGCAVHFAEPTAWQRYRWQIILSLSIIASQAFLIAALLLQRKRRQRAEVDMHAARAELAHAARLTSMGELTASIAHEIRQPLSAILAHADTAELLLETEPPPIAEIQEIVARIRSDDLRANDVITRLRDLLGKHTMERGPVVINDVIVDTARVLAAEATQRSISLETDLASGLPVVIGDRVHLQQVVMNLVLNAMDALAGTKRSGGRVIVRSTLASDGVQVIVEDNGPGIGGELMSRLFDSFVTTKPNGLGLGLSIARSIVDAHGGRIVCTNGNEGGATFRVCLPVPSPGERTAAHGQIRAPVARAAS